jgi:hypothetical protein
MAALPAPDRCLRGPPLGWPSTSIFPGKVQVEIEIQPDLDEVVVQRKPVGSTKVSGLLST